MFFINRDYYSSTDWHDWKSWNDTIFIDGNCFFNEDEVLDIIWKDMNEGNKNSKMPHIEDGESVCIFSCDDYDVEISKEGNTFTLKIDSWASTRITYYIHRATNPKFVPIRQMIEAPKIHPGIFRCECGMFDTFEEAQKALLTMPQSVNISPFIEEEKRIIVINEEDTVNDPLWEKEKKLIKLREEDPEKYYKTFKPFITQHLQEV